MATTRIKITTGDEVSEIRNSRKVTVGLRHPEMHPSP